MTRRNVTAAILASELAVDVGSIADIKAAIAAAPPAQQPGAFIDLDDMDVTTDQSAKLMTLTGLALDRASDILQVFPSRMSETFGEELRAQTSTIKTVLATQLRVDENQLRRRTVDALPQLLKDVAAEEKRLASIKGASNEVQRKVA